MSSPVAGPGRVDLAFPFGFDARGRTAAPADHPQHVRELLEQLLFTSPGERVNRPDFGCGLLQLLFAPNSPELAATVEYTARAAVQRWLGDVLDLLELRATADESVLTVDVRYVVRRTGRETGARFVREVSR
ncbi:GPW/gp25 family protein [Kitasatospora sp. CM 4170]|uniref:GPW/gp25 family protein n=1 Tax=Kitasatospora aburaviensis TaxID=67265 RepID=A0ABW1EQ92_9ACTN|nr:GPW/gp25 family protein [Kitasatospora sp. CM 4170]WNM44444.1 GPW/gp25 family protein [Kitasatospora sp. CM 4170]